MTLDKHPAEWFKLAVAAFEKDGGADLIAAASESLEQPNLPHDALRLPQPPHRWPSVYKLLPAIATRITERQRMDMCETVEERMTKGPKEGIEDDLRKKLHVPKEKLVDAFTFYSQTNQTCPPELSHVIQNELLGVKAVKDSRTRTWEAESFYLRTCGKVAIMYDYLKQIKYPDPQPTAFEIIADYIGINENTLESWWKSVNRNISGN